jgi:hypothetical protein
MGLGHGISCRSGCGAEGLTEYAAVRESLQPVG